jgi:endonuclease-3
MNNDKRRQIFERLRALNPEPKTELEYATPFQLLVAVVLSAQPTPEAMWALGVEGLAAYIRTIGLYQTKAKNVHALCRQLIDRHGSEVPREREALEALPGVGRKTANVVLNTAFGLPTIAVDTHIFRVANRTGMAPGKDVRAVEARLEKVVPAEFRRDAHHWLILHGRYVCQARKPKCPECPIRDLCDFKGKTGRDTDSGRG